MEDVWNSLKEIIRSKLSETSYKVWIAPLSYKGMEGNSLVLECPNRFFASWVQEHYLSLLKDEPIFKERRLTIRLTYGKGKSNTVRNQLYIPKFAPYELSKPHFLKRFTFDEFVVGESNQYAFNTCWSAAHEEIKGPGIIYLHAKAGLGKSHLTQAVGQTFLERKPKARLCYTSANEFTSQVVRAIKAGNMDAMKCRYGNVCDVLLLEEVHALAGRERTQAELALAIDTMVDSGKMVIFTGNQLPGQIPKLSDHLRSRLNSGLIVSINPPDHATRRKIIDRKIRKQGFVLSDEVLDFLAERLRGDIRRIEGAVVGLAARASFLRSQIDLDMARAVVENLAGEPMVINIETIKNLVCRHYKVTQEDLKSKVRKRSIAWPRQLAMYLSRHFTDSPLEAIGREFNRDHATVLHSVKQITKYINESAKLKGEVDYLISQIEKWRWQG
ncbi:MAG: chromosomal replication initiator protein DnaA [Dissulfurimicrobium sp.]|uniref:chromosomal replication initiator protein DnaA n=1 Tax=Dissulfurimicrobium sp. TaxID=2022436 RepID=UPI00404B5172